MLWSLHTENAKIISRGIIFDVLRTIWSRYFNVTDTFCQFCGIYGINDLESRLEVIWGRWFLHQSKARTSIVTLVLSCRVSEILELLYAESRFFDTPPLFRSKFQGVPLGVDPCCWGLQRKCENVKTGVYIYIFCPEKICTTLQVYSHPDKGCYRSY